GEYSTEIILATNDPAEEFIFITVNMTVFTVDNDPAGLPQVTGIQSVFPNPFNPQTCFKYALSEPANVKLDIYNIKGQLVKELVNEYQSGGNYSLIWQADKAVSGVYFYRFQAGNEYQTGKLILLK
ncbi:MAG: T9SS type A sorting domain-containing protein, partial [Candidatus Stygibacter australis]|nr:T9SS type A sorting domain-containing protein [Candidatus Stygibacter australis]